MFTRPFGSTPGRSLPAVLRPRSRRAAFTIVEVLVATAVMVFGISSAIIVIQSGFRALDTARNTTLASQIIQSELERVRLLSWTAVAALPSTGSLNFADIFPAGETTDRIARRFTVVRTAADVHGKTGEIREIALSVTWRGIDGISHTRTSSTQYAKNGLYDYYYTKARS